MSKIRLDNLFAELGLDKLDLEDPEVFDRVKKELEIAEEIARAEEEGKPLSPETYKKIGEL